MLPGGADAAGPQTALWTLGVEKIFLKGMSAVFPTLGALWHPCHSLLKSSDQGKNGPGIELEWKLMKAGCSSCFVPNHISRTQNCAWIMEVLSIYFCFTREIQQRCPFPGIF